ncbi:DnaJ homolog subfamily C member 7 [Linum perenne]
MPPPALDIDSVSTMDASRDPNPFGSTFSFDFGWDSQGSYNAFTCGNGGQLDSKSGARSAAPGRTRPRMVKVRKQLSGRNKVASDGIGFNPFHILIREKCDSVGVDCSGTGGFVFGIGTRVGSSESESNDAVNFSSGAGFSFEARKEQSDNTGVSGSDSDSYVAFGKDRFGPALNLSGVKNQSVEATRASFSDDSSGASCQGQNVTGASSFDSSNNEVSTTDGCTAETARKDTGDLDSASMNLVGDLNKLNIGVDAAGEKDSRPGSIPSFAFGSGKVAPRFTGTSVNTNIHEESRPDVTESEDLGSNKEQNSTIPCASSECSSSEPFTVQSEFASSSFEGGIEHGQVSDDSDFNQAASTSSSSWIGIGSGVSDAPDVVPTRGENNSCSTSSSDGLEVPVTEFRTPEWDPDCLKASLFPEVNKKLDPTSNTRLRRDKKWKSSMGRKKHSSQNNHLPDQAHVKYEDSPKVNLKSPQSFSPMDFSPYGGDATEEQFDFTYRVDSNDSESHLTMNAGHSSEENIAEDHGKARVEVGGCHSLPADFLFGTGLTLGGSGAEPVYGKSSIGVVSDSLRTESNQQAQFHCDSEVEMKPTMFSFSAGCSANNLPEKKHRYKKKNGRKPNGSFVISSSPDAKLHSSSLQDLADNYTTNSSFDKNTAQEKTGNFCSGDNDQVTRPFVPPTIAIIGACESWRQRGNEVYKAGDLSKAEDFYTQGINSVPSGELSACLEPLVICYSNRAATRLSLGNIRGALQDSLVAASLDPSFLKAQMRAANCYLLLGEVKDALQHFNKCMEASNGVCLDRRITIEAASGVQKTQKVADCIERSNELLEQKNPDASPIALEKIAEALSHSPYSERLLQLKAEFMFLLRKYEEVIKLCEQTLPAGEANFASIGNDGLAMNDIHRCSFPRLWRWRLTSKCYFNLGKLDAALDLLGNVEKMGPFNDKYASGLFESSMSLMATIRDLQNRKSAGNDAFQCGNYKEAVEQYSAVLSGNIESRPFAAICFCNRAAAYQAMGNLADAIADCSLAVALDENYSKAVSRRATLHEMIRDYGQSASDLQRFIAVRENRSDVGQSSTPQKSSGGSRELKQYRKRLASMEEEAKKGIPLDLYKILGVKESDSAADIKKAYRKAALRHHPDKAGQFLARSETGDGLWKEIVDKVHVDADRLFKMIGEAYAVLSDTTKRSKYDLEEEIRKVAKETRSNRRTTTAETNYSSPFGSSYRRNRQDNWKTYGHSYYRW